MTRTSFPGIYSHNYRDDKRKFQLFARATKICTLKQLDARYASEGVKLCTRVPEKRIDLHAKPT